MLILEEQCERRVMVDANSMCEGPSNAMGGCCSKYPTIAYLFGEMNVVNIGDGRQIADLDAVALDALLSVITKTVCFWRSRPAAWLIVGEIRNPIVRNHVLFVVERLLFIAGFKDNSFDDLAT